MKNGGFGNKCYDSGKNLTNGQKVVERFSPIVDVVMLFTDVATSPSWDETVQPSADTALFPSARHCWDHSSCPAIRQASSCLL